MMIQIDRILSCRFFRRPDPCESFAEIFKWWEVRRIPYNLIVGTTGVATCILWFVLALIADNFNEHIDWPDPPISLVVNIVIYGIAANVCYTGGWATEWVVKKIWKEKAGAFGQINFCLGLIFSVLLTLLPVVLVAAGLIIGLLLKP